MLLCAQLEFSVILLVCVYFLSSAAGLDASNQASTHELTIPNDVSALIQHMTLIHWNARLAITAFWLPTTEQQTELTSYHPSSSPRLLPS